MQKSLSFLDVLLKDIERCLKKLKRLSAQEEGLLNLRRWHEVKPLLHAKNTLILRVNQLEKERRAVQKNLNQFPPSGPMALYNFQWAQCRSRLKRLKKMANSLIVQNEINASRLEKLREQGQVEVDLYTDLNLVPLQ